MQKKGGVFMAEESGSSGILDILKLGLTFKAIDLVEIYLTL